MTDAALLREGSVHSPMLRTVLRTDQYTGLESFREVEEFIPLQVNRQGKVIREVALACFGLPLPEHPGQELEVRVVLIRDLRRLVPKEPLPEEEDRLLQWDEKPDGTHEYWLDENWQATPLPAPSMEPKLIPIVTTAAEVDAVELVQIYTRRWPAQENAIRDWLIPLGIDHPAWHRCQSWLCQKRSFSCQGVSIGAEKVLKSNSSRSMIVPSTEIWQRCVQR